MINKEKSSTGMINHIEEVTQEGAFSNLLQIDK